MLVIHCVLLGNTCPLRDPTRTDHRGHPTLEEAPRLAEVHNGEHYPLPWLVVGHVEMKPQPEPETAAKSPLFGLMMV